jgi:predicted methyltransferase
MDLDDVKKTIEAFNKSHQIEILRIIQQCSASIINENKNGIYINMTFLSPETIENIKQYIDYVQDQEKMLKPMESQKEDFKNTFFIEKEVNPLLGRTLC